jgi:hypothetical protein
MRALLTLHVLAALAACGGGASSDDDGDDTPPVDAPPGTPDGSGGCPRTAGPADGPRHVVVARPYAPGGAAASTWEVLDLSATGELTRPTPPRIFEMGRATSGAIAFTPDGEVGLVAQGDGTLGVFRLAGGVPSVVHAAFAGAFYASRVVIDPRGDRAWVLDGNWRENGGGIYGVAIGCDGTLTETGLHAPAKLPAALVVTGDRALVAAADIGVVTVGDDVHLVRWGEPPSNVDSADAFGAEDPIVGGAALTADGATFLVGDISQFSGAPNRVAMVGIAGDVLTPLAALPVEDPAAIATSPFGDVAVVASAFGDALVVLDTGGPGGAWRVRGEVAYQGAGPQLPVDLAPITRGTLAGRVLVGEVSAIRQLAFRASGAVEDVGSLGFGGGVENIVGALGVTP